MVSPKTTFFTTISLSGSCMSDTTTWASCFTNNAAQALPIPDAAKGDNNGLFFM